MEVKRGNMISAALAGATDARHGIPARDARVAFVDRGPWHERLSEALDFAGTRAAGTRRSHDPILRDLT